MTDIKNINLSHLQPERRFRYANTIKLIPLLCIGVFIVKTVISLGAELRMIWYCQSCKLQCQNAHIQALMDYHMLVGDTISNSDCRKFLNIGSQYVAKRPLQKLNLSRTGPNRIRKYYLSSLYVDSPLTNGGTPPKHQITPLTYKTFANQTQKTASK